MMIRIQYSDGRFDMVKATLLDGLIESKKIECFKRNSGWIAPNKDSIRGQGGSKSYSGIERREAIHQL
jgi:hypothetical protein